MSDNHRINLEELSKENKVYVLNNRAVIEFSKWMSENDYSRTTSQSYCYVINRMIGKKYKIGISIIKKFLSGDSKKTLIKYAAIRLFISFLDDKYSINFPYFRYPRFKRVIKPRQPAPTKEEVKLLIKEFNSDYIKNHRQFDYTLFIEFKFRLGLRVSEGIKLRINNFDWNTWIKDKNKWGEVAIVKSKNRRSRQLPVAPDLMSKIYVQVNNEKVCKSDFVFDFNSKRHKELRYKDWKKKGKHVIMGSARAEEAVLLLYIRKCSNDISVRIKELSKKAIGREIKSHGLRAAKATDLDESEVGITKIRDFLGHENISTTSIYLRSKEEAMKKAIIENDNF